MASSFGASSLPLRPLLHQDARSLLASDVSQSFGFQGQTVAPPDITPVPPVDLPGMPATSRPPSTPSSTTQPEPFKLVKIKDAKAYLNNYNLIQYYLRIPDFSTGRSDGILKTDPSNAEASRVWEGQICLAVKDGSLRFLFENKRDLFHGRGLEMLATLDQHCRPDTVSNAFSSLLSLFNEVQGDSKPILEYRSRFDGLILDMSRCKVAIPQILLVMPFLWVLNSRYSAILDQFRSRFKSLDLATIDLVVEDFNLHDSFKVVDSKKEKKHPTPAGRIPAAASTVTDRKGTVYNNPFNWLVKWGHKGIKTQSTWALAGTGICPICHWDEKPWHIPANCPLLKELNLKLIQGPPSSSTLAPARAPAPAALTPAPSPGRCAVVADGLASTGSSGSGTAPSGMTTALNPVEEYEYDEDFCWAGDEDDVGYCSACPSPKSNGSVAPYFNSPSCNHVWVESIFSSPPSFGVPCLAALASQCIHLPKSLHCLLGQLSLSSFVCTQSVSLVVADTGVTDHMTPHKSVFISYKAVTNLQVRMGNNSFVPILGRGTAIFSLNGQRILV